MRSLQNCRHRPSDLVVVSCRLFRLLIEGFVWLNTQPSFLNILPSILILVRSIWTRTCFAVHQLERYLRVRPLGSGLSQGALRPSLPLPPGCWFFRGLAFLSFSEGPCGPLCLCRPAAGSFGVWPFLGGLSALPALRLCRPSAISQHLWCVFRGLAFLGGPYGPPCVPYSWVAVFFAVIPASFGPSIFFLSFLFFKLWLLVMFGRSNSLPAQKIRDTAEVLIGGVF